MQNFFEKTGFLIRKIVQMYTKNDIYVYAGHAALMIITAFFPFLILVITVVNLLPGYSPDALISYLFQFLPDLDYVRDYVKSVIVNLQENSSGVVVSLTAITILWSSSLGISAVQKGLKKLSPVQTKLPEKATALVFTILSVLLLPVIIIFDVLSNFIVTLADQVALLFHAQALSTKLISVLHIGDLIAMAAAALLVLLIYTFLPGGHPNFRRNIPGTILTAVTWKVFTALFSFFIRIFSQSFGIYGSLATLFLIIMWLRFELQILFCGAALNAVLEQMKTAEPLPSIVIEESGG